MNPLNPKPLHYDSVERPRYYNLGKVECIDALEAATVALTGIEAVCTAMAIKYLWRWKLKNGVEDLKKSIWYLNKLIAHEEHSKLPEPKPAALSGELGPKDINP